MKLSATVATLCATLTLAAPATDLETRASTRVYLCNDRGFTGYCVPISSPSGTCVPLGTDLNDKISSVGPDPGSFCYFFVNANCDTSGDFFHVGNPGYSDLSITPVNGPTGSTRNFEDKLSSYRCTLE